MFGRACTSYIHRAATHLIREAERLERGAEILAARRKAPPPPSPWGQFNRQRMLRVHHAVEHERVPPVRIAPRRAFGVRQHARVAGVHVFEVKAIVTRMLIGGAVIA